MLQEVLPGEGKSNQICGADWKAVERRNVSCVAATVVTVLRSTSSPTAHPEWSLEVNRCPLSVIAWTENKRMAKENRC